MIVADPGIDSETRKPMIDFLLRPRQNDRHCGRCQQASDGARSEHHRDGLAHFYLRHERFFSFLDAGRRIPVPADGTTATNLPAGYYFPQMVMDLNILPGVANTVMSAMQGTGMGNSQVGQPATTALGVYLPRVESTIFHTVDAMINGDDRRRSGRYVDRPEAQGV